MIKSWRELKEAILGKGAKRPAVEGPKIVNPYVGLTDAQIIETRRALYNGAYSRPIIERREERRREQAQPADSFATGMLMGVAISSMGGSPSVPLSDPSPSFEPGGGEMGGGGASESFDSPSSDTGGGSSDMGGGGGE